MACTGTSRYRVNTKLSLLKTPVRVSNGKFHQNPIPPAKFVSKDSFSPEAIIQIYSTGDPQVNRRDKTVGLTQSEILSSFQTMNHSRSYS